MRAIRPLLVFVALVVAGVLTYNYWSGYGWTLQPPAASGGIDAERARERGVEIAEKAAAGEKTAAARTNEIVGEAGLTAKIKSKMALDDYVKARTIDVDSNGSVVTLRGRCGRRRSANEPSGTPERRPA